MTDAKAKYQLGIVLVMSNPVKAGSDTPIPEEDKRKAKARRTIEDIQLARKLGVEVEDLE
jgi:hypothetical protein